MSEKIPGEGSDPVNDIFSGATDDRDLSEMVARDGQRVITRFTLVLGVAVLFLGGIIAGSYFQSSNGSAATGAGAALASARTGAAGSSARGTGAASGFSGFGGGGGGFSAPVASGQIQLIDGTNVYVTTQTGSIVKVATDATTRIRQSTTLTVKQLKVGDTVSVSGQSGADGTVTAASINVGALPVGLGTGATGSATKSGSAAPSTTSSTQKPSVTGGGAGRNTALIACLKKNGVTVDPTQGTRALRNSTDPKVQAAFAKCRTSAFPSGGASPSATP
jgi:hypothetical protein